MNKFYFIFLLINLNLILIACSKHPDTNVDVDLPQALTENNISTNIEKLIKNRCIQDWFAQGQSDNLYGIDCIKGKQLYIQTDKEGSAITSSHSINGLRLEEELSFINKVYNPKYKILKNKGDDKTIPFLKDFLPENESFFGSLDTKYNIVFETSGNYLILFKASKDIQKIPYIERTSMTEKEGYKMVPFIGYPIQYCDAEVITNIQGEETYESRANCNSDPNTAKYIRILKTNKQVYQYKEKKDLFPSNYFKGRWFFSKGPIETASREGHLAPFFVDLIKFEKTSQALQVIDASGNVEDRNKTVLSTLPVHWLDYETDKDGDVFKSFGERTHKKNDLTKRDYLQINFLEFIKQGAEVIDFLITKDYFSFVIKTPDHNGKNIKYKFSFLKETATNSKGFIPRKWFIDDHNHRFGVLPTQAQDEQKEGESTETELLDHLRMIRFNINNQESIKWYFSKNSTQDPFYREIAREVFEIWNHSFQIITKNTDKKIKVELIETEEKDLGDIRYNIINLVKTEDISLGGRGGLLGAAPSYVNPDTGQIIGTTANILLQNILEISHSLLRNYIRYEIFQKDKKSQKEQETHVINPFLKTKIEDQCPEITQFIDNKKKEKLKGKITPQTELQDRNLILGCSKKVSRDEVLHLILHETGHSFGLGHNFKASVDKNNYYQSKSEIKSYFPMTKWGSDTLPKSSSVMDYFPLFYPSLTSLGKYDLAALKFLYMNQIETKEEGKVITLDIPEDLNMQKPLTSEHLSQMKTYQHCSDYVSRENDFLCIQHDYGSNPLEISNFYINSFTRSFNSARYRYDAVIEYNRNGQMLLNQPLSPYYLGGIGIFYKKWLSLTSQYLNSQNALKTQRPVISEDKSSIENYQKTIEGGLGVNEEYDLYKAVRNNISQFMMDFLLLKSMKCQVLDHNKQSRWINLEDIKNTLLPTHKDKLYVEDCYSEMITNFLETEGLILQDQKGLEDFQTLTYYSEGKNQANKWDVISLSEITASLLQNTDLLYVFSLFTSEPDFYDKFRLILENQLLEIEEGQNKFDINRISILYNFLIKLMQELLNRNEDASLLKSNLNQVKLITFSLGTSSDSFYNKVEKPLKEGLTIEEIEIPFLKESYEEYENYIEEQPDQAISFQMYLLKLNNVLNRRNEDNTFIIPYNDKSSFSHKLILKYNENLKELKKLEMLKLKNNKLTFIERLEQKEIETHNQALYNTITILANISK